VGNTTIEINGKRYDAQSGDFLGEGTKSVSQVKQPSRQGRVVDGFVRVQKPASFAQKQPVKSQSSEVITALPREMQQPKVVDQMVKKTRSAAHTAAPKPAVGHKTQRAKTLMRRALQ
jgi:hypothetical protein